jgi:hypothetical protein
MRNTTTDGLTLQQAARFFSAPEDPQQRQYEALRAYFVEGLEPSTKTEPVLSVKAEPLSRSRVALIARRAPLAQLTRSSKREVSADQV